MTLNIFRVEKINQSYEESRESSISFITKKGDIFSCCCDYYKELSEGDLVKINSLSCLGIEYDDLFTNEKHEKKLNQINQWEYVAYGEVIEVLSDSTIVFDCGDVFLPIENVTSDDKIIESWVKFYIERLDAIEIKKIES